MRILFYVDVFFGRISDGILWRQAYFCNGIFQGDRNRIVLRGLDAIIGVFLDLAGGSLFAAMRETFLKTILIRLQ